MKAIPALAVAALVLALPVLVSGPLLLGHDTKEHISFGQYFAEQLWQGDFYPRWLLNVNYGLGSASFFVYPPFPSYVYSLLLPVARIVHLDAFGLGEYLCLLTSGLCAFLWMTTIASRQVSLLAATIYMILPYHLTIDFYRRDALSECWALAWMPLVLYFTTQVVRKKGYATAGLALSYALLIVSHLVSVLILSALPFLLALTIAERGRKARAFFTVAGCLALGAAVSSAYLLPAFANAKYFPVSRLGISIDDGPQGNLLAYGWGLLTGHSGKSRFLQAVSLATVDTVSFIAFCGFMALRKGPRSHRGQLLLWLAVCPVPLFLMSEPSLRIWKVLPALADAVQFPWRFDVVLCIAALPLAAFLLTNVISLPARSKVGVLVVVILFATTWFGGYVDVVRHSPQDHSDAGTKLSVHDGWFAAWTARGMDQDSALEASTGPAARFLEGHGTATVLIWKPRHIEVLTDCAACGPLVVRQLYYPKWKARLVSGGVELLVEPKLPQGVLAVRV
ncbi:MAG TPA: hypothetical protein VM912_14795, partial [Terriglobales bacterium]|nr:hypothetical protein [Terriglobales bacterium]